MIADENGRMFDLVRGMAIITGIFLLGDFFHRWGVPIPGGVLGLLLFYGALLSGLLKLVWVERAAGLLLRHMVLLFVPLAVGLMDFGEVISRHAWPIVASLIVSFFAVLLFTGLLGQRLLGSTESEPLEDVAGIPRRTP